MAALRNSAFQRTDLTLLRRGRGAPIYLHAALTAMSPKKEVAMCWTFQFPETWSKRLSALPPSDTTTSSMTKLMGKSNLSSIMTALPVEKMAFKESFHWLANENWMMMFKFMFLSQRRTLQSLSTGPSASDTCRQQISLIQHLTGSKMPFNAQSLRVEEISSQRAWLESRNVLNWAMVVNVLAHLVTMCLALVLKLLLYFLLTLSSL